MVFCTGVWELLQRELVSVRGVAALNLLRYAWTNAIKNALIGFSIAFVNEDCVFTDLTLFASTNNDNHMSLEISSVIRDRCLALFGLYIDTSVTSRCWKQLTDRIKARRSLQTDCSKYVLNLCFSYGLGLREDYENVVLLNSETNNIELSRACVTKVGEFKAR